MAFPVAESLIDRAEAELGRVLPPAYRERLLRDNGGDITASSELGEDEWQLHPVWDDSDRKRAGRTASHIVRETNAARAWDVFPDGAIAIADNGTGDRLIVLAGLDEVRWLDHETGEVYLAAVEWD